jgi:hypothetical protein
MDRGSGVKTLKLVGRVADTFLRSYPAAAAFLLFVFLIVVMIVWATLSDAYSAYEFDHLSSAEHLRLAQEACHSKQYGTICVDSAEALPHLNKISRDAPEYVEAAKLMDMIRIQEQNAEERERQAAAARQAELVRLANQSEEESREQMQGNMAGSAHDSYRCSVSAASTTVVSFDNGHYWWPDDGRCAAEEKRAQAAEQQKQNEQAAARERAQRYRDEEAEVSSYWPTTLRVNTDMDSFWLNNEERTCQTFPDDKGRITRVTCSENASHQVHSIPVKFWGGVDRNTVSNWNCRREGDEFVCRSID